MISPRSDELVTIIDSSHANSLYHRGANGAANHETVLTQEGVQVERGNLGERTVDFRVYGWFPNQLPSREAEQAADEVSDEEDDDQRLFV